MGWGALARQVGPLDPTLMQWLSVQNMVIASIGALLTGVLSFGVRLLYRFSKGEFVSLREHQESLDREARSEARYDAEREAHRETRETLREVSMQNSLLVSAASISTEVMRKLDQRAQEGGGG